MRNLILSLTIVATTFTSIFAMPTPNPSRIGETYVEQYRQIAIMESLRSGIPASIKLAQGLLESGFGQGALAMSSNNHFGIKWRSPNDGDYVEAMDDDTDKNGNRVASRFVKFSSPEQSYQHHSEMLMTRPVYRVLFTYDRTDYRSWARGLQRVGYATNPKYADHLIQIIQQYGLDRFDIPTQVDSNESETASEYNQQPDPRKSFPARPTTATKVKTEYKVTAVRTVANAPKNTAKNIVKEEEEHILYEVTSSPDVAKKKN
jgi:hypothetical protein